MTRQDPWNLPRRTATLLVPLLYLLSAATAQPKSEWEQRDEWQRPADIMRALDLSRGDWVADIGSGDGYLVRYLLEATGSEGKVFAVDIDKKVLKSMRTMFGDRNPALHIVLGEKDDPKLPPLQLHAAVMIQSYHEMTFANAMLRHVWDSLIEGGRLVIIEGISESRASASRTTQTAMHEISSKHVEQELRDVGYEIFSVDENFTKPRYTWLQRAL